MNLGLPMYYGAAPILFQYARAMRLAPTKAEKVMHEILINQPCKQHNFRRQHPIATYIADFYSHSLKLVIEIDGSVHDLEEQKAYDGFRDEEMAIYGITVKRFTNQQVLETPEVVMATLQTEINNIVMQGGR